MSNFTVQLLWLVKGLSQFLYEDVRIANNKKKTRLITAYCLSYPPRYLLQPVLHNRKYFELFPTLNFNAINIKYNLTISHKRVLSYF